MSKLLHIHYQDLKDDVLEQAKKVNLIKIICILNPTRCLFQTITETFETQKEERIIANKIRQEFDKIYGKCVDRFEFE